MHKSGSPYDRGSADRYYGRPFSPHCYKNESGEYIDMLHGNRVDELTEEEKKQYRQGWEEETGQKDWGSSEPCDSDDDCGDDDSECDE